MILPKRFGEATIRSVLLLFLLVPMLPAAAPAQERDFVPLFDGKSLDGWEGNRELFRVVDGSIVGGTLDSEIVAD